MIFSTSIGVDPFQTVDYSNPNLFGVPVNVVNGNNETITQDLMPIVDINDTPSALTIDNLIDKEAVATTLTNGKVPLGEQQGLLPDITKVPCSQIAEVITDAETLSTTWRPTPELLSQFETWLQKAKEKQQKCVEASVKPVPQKKLSKNLTPIVILLGAVVASVVVYKIVKR